MIKRKKADKYQPFLFLKYATPSVITLGEYLPFQWLACRFSLSYQQLL